jgi:hypothetical protein
LRGCEYGDHRGDDAEDEAYFCARHGGSKVHLLGEEGDLAKFEVRALIIVQA